MAIIYDFPTNYKEQLQKCDELIEKGYLDQAICYLEDINDKRYSVESRFLFKKKLLTCYMLKKEFEMCQTLIDTLEQEKTIDLSVRAHDILLKRQLGGLAQELLAKQKHATNLGALSSYYRALLELTAELKAYYESFWMQEVSNKINQFIQTTSVQEQFYIISDLQHFTVEELSGCEDVLVQYFKGNGHPITKTLLAEVLINKELAFNVSWSHDEDVLETMLNDSLLGEVHELIAATYESALQCYYLSDEALDILHQHIVFFYQYACPFGAKIDKITVVHFLIQQLGIESEQKSDIIDSRVENKPIINYTTCKLRQYLLSLTSLI